MNEFNVLIVDDDEEFVGIVKELLERNGYNVLAANTGEEAIGKYNSAQKIDLVLVDLVMPMMDGITLMDKIKSIDTGANIIIVTGQGTIQNAVEAIKKGAIDFITKPFDKDILLKKINILKKSSDLENRVAKLHELISSKYGFDNLISSSKSMQTAFEKALAASRNDATVFIIGETGTGKEILAKSIHVKSDRKNYPFIAVNCGSIPKELLESELFGYKRGSFTGAHRDYEGLFMAANKGTLFLDEIGEMPKELQVRLLRVLQGQKIRHIGSPNELSVDVRIIAASNHTINELKDKVLREDLFFRLAVIVIELPPLRDRREDIPLLIQHFIDTFNRKYNRNIECVSESVLGSLMSYEFPGNVRELENLIEGLTAVSAHDKKVINDKDLKSHLIWHDSKQNKYLVLSLEQLEKHAIDQALRQSKGNKSKASELLGISRDTLYRKLKQYKIQ